MCKESGSALPASTQWTESSVDTEKHDTLRVHPTSDRCSNRYLSHLSDVQSAQSSCSKDSGHPPPPFHQSSSSWQRSAARVHSMPPRPGLDMCARSRNVHCWSMLSAAFLSPVVVQPRRCFHTRNAAAIGNKQTNCTSQPGILKSNI